MKIHIKNLGPVHDAQFDLNKKLTIFCGRNNTGKTYVSYIIHALLSQLVFIQFPEPVIEPISNSEEKYIVHFSTETITKFRDELVHSLKDRLDNIFGISEQHSNKAYFSKFNIFFDTDNDTFLKRVLEEEFERKFIYEDTSFSVNKKNGTLDVELAVARPDSLDLTKPSPTKYYLLSILLKALVLYPITKSEIFPVERNSIYTFSKELSINRNLLIDQMQELNNNAHKSPMELFFRSSTRYPQAIRDGLYVANDLNEIQKHNSPFLEFADALESDLLHGKVNIGKEGEVYFCPEKFKSAKMPIHLSASIIKTLTSLVLYLRHRANRNDLIIIDEPELNLHPDNQVVLARLFARLINQGFRLLVSTHSDYIIREFNNLIMLGAMQDSKQSRAMKLGNYTVDEQLKAEDVGVYFFDFNFRGQKKVKVQSIEVTNTGFDIQTIDETINKQSNISQDLYELLMYAD